MHNRLRPATRLSERLHELVKHHSIKSHAMPDLFGDKGSLHRLTQQADLRVNKLNGRRAPLSRLRIETTARLVGNPVVIAGRLLELAAIGLTAVFLAVVEGVQAMRQLQDTDVEAFFDQQVDRFLRGVLPGGIRIEIHDDRLGMATQQARMVLRQRGAATCNHVLHVAFLSSDHVHIAFD